MTRSSVENILTKQGLGNKQVKNIDNEPQLRDMLNKCVDDELMLTALLLTSSSPRTIPSNKNLLINLCITELHEFHFYHQIKELNFIKEDILNMSFKADEFRWIDKKMSLRLEEFLRRSIDATWVDIDKSSERQRFILTFKKLMIEDQSKVNMTIYRLQKAWEKIKKLDELKNLTKKDSESFLKYFSEAHTKIVMESIGGRLNRAQIAVVSRTLSNYEDVLILLDTFYGDNSITRQSVVGKIRSNWKQKNNRKNPDKEQINASVPVEIKNGLRHLAKKHNITETQVISILITKEIKNELYIKPL